MTAGIIALSFFTIFLLVPHVSLSAEGIGPETDALSRAVQTYVSTATRWKEAEVEVRSIERINEIELPAGSLRFRVSSGSSVPTFRGLVLPIEASLDGRPVSNFWIKAEIRIHTNLVQAVRRLTYGSIVGSEDVAVREAEISDPRAEYLATCDLAVGKLLRRSLSPGDPLTRDSVINPVLIRNGETVRLLLQRGTVSLAAAARAEQDGRLGQVIRVRNLDFSHPVKALVIGRGEVRIE